MTSIWVRLVASLHTLMACSVIERVFLFSLFALLCFGCLWKRAKKISLSHSKSWTLLSLLSISLSLSITTSKEQVLRRLFDFQLLSLCLWLWVVLVQGKLSYVIWGGFRRQRDGWLGVKCPANLPLKLLLYPPKTLHNYTRVQWSEENYSREALIRCGAVIITIYP